MFGRIVNPEYGSTVGGRREIGGERANEACLDRRVAGPASSDLRETPMRIGRP